MGKLRVLSGREVCRILQQHGFVEVRRRGSHIVSIWSDPHLREVLATEEPRHRGRADRLLGDVALIYAGNQVHQGGRSVRLPTLHRRVGEASGSLV